MKAKSSGHCKVYVSLLVLCYLEVLLWTSCLLTSCAAAPVPALDGSHSYLLRETGNLKLATTDHSEVVPSGPSLSLKNIKTLYRLEHSQARLACQHCEKPPDNTEAKLSLISPLRSIPISTGLPAPWTGIKAIS